MTRGIEVLGALRTVTLSTCGRQYAGARGDAVICAAWLDDRETTTWLGVPTTTVARTVVDIARTGMRPGIVAVESALCWGLVTPHELEETVARQHHWHGVITARAVLDLAGDGSESPLESLTRLFLHDRKIALPRQQAHIETILGTMRVDGLWDDLGVILEVDGMIKYRVAADGGLQGTVNPLDAEKIREEALASAGYTVIRMNSTDLHRWPELTEARIRRVLARAQAARRLQAAHAVP